MATTAERSVGGEVNIALARLERAISLAALLRRALGPMLAAQGVDWTDGIDWLEDAPESLRRTAAEAAGLTTPPSPVTWAMACRLVRVAS